jgi:hypothetical protein
VKRVHLHIERLVLDGFPALNREVIGTAVERELHQLLARDGIGAAQSGNLPQVNGGKFTLARLPTASGVGAQIGRAVHGAIKTGGPRK